MSKKIAAYMRISVDTEKDRDNTSIENQRRIIRTYVKQTFPDAMVDYYEDRDKSGYTFEQREDYQRMRPLLMDGTYDILIIKDFSRFSRRNSRGLVELEDLRDAGVRIIYDIGNLGIIGVVEVIRHLSLFFKLRTFLRHAMMEEKPDAVVCVDYPGFNMKIAHVAKELGIPVVYYIAPTIWAWHKGRAKNIVRDVEHVASIFPFEAEAYREAGARVTFVGHPLADTVKASMSYEEAMIFFGGDRVKKRILLMPGSRKNEVEKLLPAMLKAADILTEKCECQFFLPRAGTISSEFIQGFLKNASPRLDIIVTAGRIYDLMQICTACIASSGTATLETALMGLPTVLVYRLSAITWFLAKHLVRVEYAGLPNILLHKEVTPELLQDKVTAGNIAEVVLPWLIDEVKRQENIRELKSVRAVLGEGGAVRRTAELILRTAEGK
jgi:lipid-A-disaccharide synthase